MAVINLGRVSPFPRGQYSVLTEYGYLDLVTDSGSSYLYINSTPAAGVPVTDTTHWQQIASRGMTGPSAYDAAVAGGYTGTEADFNAANAGIEAANELLSAITTEIDAAWEEN